MAWTTVSPWRGSERTFREFTNVLLHVRHRVPLRRGLLPRSISAVSLLRIVGRCPLRIRVLARLLLLLLLRVLLVGILLLVLEQQLARELLVKLGLLSLLKGGGSAVSVAD